MQATLKPRVKRMEKPAKNILVVDDQGTHAEIRREGETYVLVDVSKNGILLNGGRVTSMATLHHGDEILLPGMKLVFECDDATKTLTSIGGTPDLRVDVERAQVWIRGSKVEVTAKEFQALVAMDVRRGKLIRKDELAKAVWPEFEGAVSDESIEQLVLG